MTDIPCYFVQFLMRFCFFSFNTVLTLKWCCLKEYCVLRTFHAIFLWFWFPKCEQFLFFCEIILKHWQISERKTWKLSEIDISSNNSSSIDHKSWMPFTSIYQLRVYFRINQNIEANRLLKKLILWK